MQENNSSENSPHNFPNKTPLNYRIVKSHQGSVWLKDAFLRFKSSVAVWLGITAFMIMLLLIPILNNAVALLMPLLLGGLMIGCHESTSSKAIKFDHLFSGLKNDGKALLLLSLIYAACSVIIMVLTVYVMQLFDVNLQEFIPTNVDKMTPEQMIEWLNSIDQSKALPILLLGFLISLALMIPLFMAIWFAPALVVLQKQSALNSFKLSYLACKDNFMPFLIYGVMAFVYLMLFFFIISLLFLILPILAIPAMIFGYLAIFAISLISIYTAYIDIFDFENNQNENDEINRQNDNNNSDDETSMLA